MIYKYLLFVCTFVAILGCSNSYGNIAVIDINEIFQKSSAGSNLNKKFTLAKESLHKVFSDKEKELFERNKSISSQKDALSETALKEKMESLNRDVIETQQSAKNESSKLEQLYYTSLDKISSCVKDIVSKESKSKNIDIVLQKSQVVYKSDTISDITESVLVQLEKNLQKVDFDFQTSVK